MPRQANADYYVYNNWHRDRGRIHHGHCPHCNHGKGRTNATRGPYDEWRGPFDRAAAFADAAALDRKEMGPCGVCHP